MNLKKLERYLRVNLLGPGPSSYEKRIYRAAVSQSLRYKETACGMDSPRGMLRAFKFFRMFQVLVVTNVNSVTSSIVFCYALRGGFELNTCRDYVNFQIVSKTRVSSSLM